jgi:hypothetical protein
MLNRRSSGVRSPLAGFLILQLDNWANVYKLLLGFFIDKMVQLHAPGLLEA